MKMQETMQMALICACCLVIGLIGQVYYYNSRQVHHYLYAQVDRFQKRGLLGAQVYDPDSIRNTIGQPSSMQVNYSMPQMQKLPDAILIGVKKGGTDTLLHGLKMNSHVVCKHGEMHFFNRNDRWDDPAGLNTYMRRFPLVYPGQINIEKTPQYLTSLVAPQRVWQMNSRIKLMFLARDPAVRLVSDYTHGYSLGFKEAGKTLEEMILTKDGHINLKYKPVQAGLYFTYIKNWMKYFPREQFLFIKSEDFVANPVPVLNTVEQFLGIPQEISDDNYVFVKDKGFYCRKFNGTVECETKNKGRKHPEVKEETMKIIRDFYRPFNEKFYKLVGRDFGWP